MLVQNGSYDNGKYRNIVVQKHLPSLQLSSSTTSNYSKYHRKQLLDFLPTNLMKELFVFVYISLVFCVILNNNFIISDIISGEVIYVSLQSVSPPANIYISNTKSVPTRKYYCNSCESYIPFIVFVVVFGEQTIENFNPLFHSDYSLKKMFFFFVSAIFATPPSE